MKTYTAEIPILLKVLFSGEAGDGILSAGETLLNAAARLGYHSSVLKNFPPTIRGGSCSALVSITTASQWAPSSIPDLEISLDQGTITRHNSIIAELPFHLCIHTRSQTPLRSSFALGALAWLLGIPKELIFEIITEKLRKKDPELTEQNRTVLESGYEQLRNGDIRIPECMLPDIDTTRSDRVILDGNHAVALGALSAGCKIYASYPITPATAIGDHLSSYLPPLGGFAYQAEDEIAALGAVIGASFSGSRAMTATSGPGLSLMQEFLGYASMTELPAVIVDVQRAGPSTGMPTKHSQDDLFAAALGGHGEGQRIVLGATSVEDCFYLTMEAFNLADHYQCPVILLSDSALGHLKTTVKRPDPTRVASVARQVCLSQESDSRGLYKRSNLESTQTCAMPVPGISPVSYRVTGVEHDEYSIPANSPENRSSQMRRRSLKLQDLPQKTGHLQIWDAQGISPGEADIGVISWGLSASVTREAVKELRNRGLKVAALYPRVLFPVDLKLYEQMSLLTGHIATVESNCTGQLSSLIRMNTGLATHPITQYRGEPFTSEEIAENLYQFYREKIPA